MKVVLPPILITANPKHMVEPEFEQEFIDALLPFLEWIRKDENASIYWSNELYACLHGEDKEWIPWFNSPISRRFLMPSWGKIQGSLETVDSWNYGEDYVQNLSPGLLTEAESFRRSFISLLGSLNMISTRVPCCLAGDPTLTGHRTYQFKCNNINESMLLEALTCPERWVCLVDWTTSDNWPSGKDDVSRQLLENGIRAEAWRLNPDWEGTYRFSTVEFTNSFMQEVSLEHNSRNLIVNALARKLTMTVEEMDRDGSLNDEYIEPSRGKPGFYRMRVAQGKHSKRIHYNLRSKSGIEFFQYTTQHQKGMPHK